MAQVSDDSPPARRSTVRRLAWGLGWVLALGATAALVVSDDARYLKVAGLAALWAFVIAALAASAGRRDESARPAAREQELRRIYELELEREVAARREYELQLEVKLRRELDAATRQDVAALHAEVRALRAASPPAAAPPQPSQPAPRPEPHREPDELVQRLPVPQPAPAAPAPAASPTPPAPAPQPAAPRPSERPRAHPDHTAPQPVTPPAPPESGYAEPARAQAASAQSTGVPADARSTGATPTVESAVGPAEVAPAAPVPDQPPLPASWASLEELHSLRLTAANGHEANGVNGSGRAHGPNGWSAPEATPAPPDAVPSGSGSIDNSSTTSSPAEAASAEPTSGDPNSGDSGAHPVSADGSSESGSYVTTDGDTTLNGTGRRRRYREDDEGGRDVVQRALRSESAGGARRHRYRDEREPDDVLSRILRQN